MAKPFRVADGADAQRGGQRVISVNAVKVLAHALDSDTDSLMQAGKEMSAPDHEVGGVSGTDSDNMVYTDANPWPPAEHYRAEPQPTSMPVRLPFKLK